MTLKHIHSNKLFTDYLLGPNTAGMNLDTFLYSTPLYEVAFNSIKCFKEGN